jgi:hypothetical protein
MQTYQLEAGEVVAFLFKTVDQWPGETGPNELDTPAAFLVRTVDHTPPYFLSGSPLVVKTYRTAARVSYELNEAATVYFVVMPQSLHVEPTAEEVFELSIQPRYQARPASVGTAAVSLGYEPSIANVTGLHGLTEYVLWAIAQDTAGNRMAAPTSVEFETLDNQPPDAVAAIKNVAATQATLTVQLDEPGTVFYTAALSGAAAASCPSGPDLRNQVQQAQGSIVHGSIVISNTNEDISECATYAGYTAALITVDYGLLWTTKCALLCTSGFGHACRVVKTLNDQTAYMLCVVAEDSFFNVETSATRLTFVTKDGTPPSIQVVTSAHSPPRPNMASFASQCFVTAEVTLSEAGSGTVAALTLADAALTSQTLLSAVNTWPPGLSDITLQAHAFTVTSAANYTTSVNLTSLACDTVVTVVLAAQDPAGNINKEVQSQQVELPDVVPPEFLAGTPQLAATSSSAAWIAVQLDEPGEASIQVYHHSTPQ